MSTYLYMCFYNMYMKIHSFAYDVNPFVVVVVVSGDQEMGVPARG